MGNASSEDNFDYEAELFAQKKLRSLEVPDDGKEHKDCGPIRRNAEFANRLVDCPYDSEDPKEQCKTIYDAFKRGVNHFGASPCLGTRKYEGKKRLDYVWQTYHDVDMEVANLGKGLTMLGLKEGMRVGICSVNRPEWTMSALSLYSQSLVTVALYDTLGSEAIEYIINHAEIEVVIVSAEKLKQVFNIRKKCPGLRAVIQFDPHPVFDNALDAIKEEDLKTAENLGIQLLGLSQVEQMGKDSTAALNPGTLEKMAFIMYTSGTTGVPKGAMLLHKNVMACVGGVFRRVLPLKDTDRHISYLPLAHIFETANQSAIMCAGGAIGFFSGDVRTLTEDMNKLRPTLFTGVPRVYQRMYEKVFNSIGNLNCLKRTVVLRAYRGNVQLCRRGQPLNQSHDNIMKKIRSTMGLADARVLVTGAAPCPPYLMEFLRVVVNPRDGIIQGYGMTETAAAVTVSELDDYTLGHVGPPLPSAEIRLRDVPEMGHSHTNNPPSGEVLARGPSIFVGYYKNEEATAETLTPDGWICTGDIGRWNPNGTLSIIDRKKNIFKLSQGEYIAAEKIESVYQRVQKIGQVFVYGNSYKPFIMAVIVPNAEQVQKHLQSKGLWQGKAPFGTSAEFRAEFKANVDKHYDFLVHDIMADMKVHEDTAKLHGFERAKDIVLEAELDEMLQGFTVANDCLTPTFKLRRPYLLKRYEQKLRDLYTKHGEKPKDSEKW